MDRRAVIDRHLSALPGGRFRFVAVDVETAGRDMAGICQIGLGLVRRDGTVATYSTLVDPGTPFTASNVRVHGITPDMVRGAPSFAEALATLRPVLEAHPLVQHSRYDERSFAAACRRDRLSSVASHWTDSVGVARRAWPGLRKPAGTGFGLASLKRHLGLRFRHHDAGEDARAAAQVVLAAEDVIGTVPALRWREEQLELPL